MQAIATIATLATVTMAGAPRCGTSSYVAPSYKVASHSYGYKAPSYGKRSYGAKSYGKRSYGAKSYGYADSYGYDDDYSYGEDYGYGDDYDLDYDYGYGRGYGGRSYGRGYGARGYGARGYGKSVGRRGHGYGYGNRGYGAYGGRSVYGGSRDYGYANRGYGYEPVVVKKDYGLWENYYRLEVETFKKTVVTDTENVWVVAYIDPACGGCKRLATQWEKLTTQETITVRKVKFGYLDITVEANREVLQTYTGGYEVKSTPTIFLYGQDKYAPVLYDGDYTVDHLNSYICGYCDEWGYGEGYGYGDDYDLGYGYDDLDYGYGRRGYGYGRRGYGYGYDASPKVLSTYGRTSSKRVEDVDYDRTVREGRSYGGYERTSVEPVYPSYGYDW